jgi:hypothetical protein
VPHFDDRRHKETHDSVYEHIKARRRRMHGGMRIERDYSRGGVLLQFMMVSSVIGCVGMSAKIFSDRNDDKESKRGSNF